MISILIQKILSMALMMALGTLLVKLKLLKSSDSRVLSIVTIYLIMPCIILTAFQIESTKDTREGLALALVAAVLIHVGMFLFMIPARKIWKLDAVEELSIFFPNCGALIVPLVIEVLGPSYVLYMSPFLVVHLFLLWSYGNTVISGENALSVRKILTNFNFISILAGLFLLFSGYRFPPVIADTMSSFSSMAGPMTMLVAGMLLGGMDLKEQLRNKRLWLVTALRLIVVPVLAVLFLKYSGIREFTSDGTSVVMVTLLAIIGPSASTLTQLAQVYDKDAEMAGAINVLTTMLCIVTMPLMIWLYQL